MIKRIGIIGMLAAGLMVMPAAADTSGAPNLALSAHMSQGGCVLGACSIDFNSGDALSTTSPASSRLTVPCAETTASQSVATCNITLHSAAATITAGTGSCNFNISAVPTAASTFDESRLGQLPRRWTLTAFSLAATNYQHVSPVQGADTWSATVNLTGVSGLTSINLSLTGELEAPGSCGDGAGGNAYNFVGSGNTTIS